MNYRHAFHAGNFADVFKHLILIEIITHLKRKSAPFRVIDTHAGAGLYGLASDEAKRTGEWLGGIGRLRAAIGHETAAAVDLRRLFAGYLNALAEAEAYAARTDWASSHRASAPEASPQGGRQSGAIYPGSPLLTAVLLRAGDRLIANELHPVDLEHLKAVLSGLRSAKTMQLDASIALKSLLPPPERRGLVLVDPPFEQPGEFDRLIDGLKAGLKRFGNGIFALWYPIKGRGPVADFKAELAKLGGYRLLAAELHLHAPDDPADLSGCGMIIANPPYQLDRFLEERLPRLAGVLSDDPARRSAIAWLSGPP